MAVTTTQGGTLITGDHIAIAQMIAAKGAITLESKGMKMSRGVNVKAAWAVKLGMSARAKHADVIAALQKRIDEASKTAV